jgi:hypothetical protein
MDKQDIRTLKILEEIESDKKLTQRDLSRELHISLLYPKIESGISLHLKGLQKRHD